MYAILGEDDSDAQTIKVLMHRLLGDERVHIKPKGYDGCGELFQKGARQLRLFADLGYRQFVVCHDADEDDPQKRREEVLRRVVRPASLGSECCVLIPVQEIEAWILADIQAVSNVFTSWSPDPIRENPETIQRPKERLELLSRGTNKKPIYSHATHNPIVAKYLALAVVRQKCPSFDVLARFLKK